MKKTILAALCFLWAIQAQAGGNKYIEAMKNTLALMDTAKTEISLQDVANRFERIGAAEKKEWLPYYWASLTLTQIARMQTTPEKIDAILDKAQELADKADEIDKNNSEIITLKGIVLSGRIAVDPMKRGPVYGMQSSQMYMKAAELDPANPRPDHMRATGLLYTPEQFGGGKAKALEVLNQAKAKYDTFSPGSEIHPDWGKEQCEQMIKLAEDPNWKAW